MKLFFIRYTKIIFSWLQLHRVVGFLSGSFLNAFYLTKLSKFIYQNKKIPINDFPSKWSYYKRYPLYQKVFRGQKGRACTRDREGNEVAGQAAEV